jgi:hypothetical protein
MAALVRNNTDASRYELLLDDRVVGIADYRVRDRAVLFPHTEIVPALQGRGLGATLVQGALDDVRSSGRTVVPQCWYVAAFIDDHPEYADLLAA